MAEAFHFRVHRSQLLPALTAVLEATDGKSKIPILANVLLKPEGDQLLLRGTNLDLEIEAGCDLLESGSNETITIKAVDLRDIVKNLPETSEIEFQPGKWPGQVRLKSGRSSFSIFCLPETDFPTISVHVSGEPFEIDMPVLSDAIRKVLYAVDRSATGRAFYEGVYIHPIDDGDRLSIVASEGRGMAVVRIKTRSRATFSGVILPLKTVMAMRKLLGDAKVPAKLTISDQMIRIECGSVSIFSKLIDAIFPQNYEHVMAVSPERNVVAVVDTVRAAVSRVLLVSTEARTDGINISLEPNLMRLEMTSQQGESAIDLVPVDYEGDAGFTIGLNGMLMAGMLDSIETQDVNIGFAQDKAPALFRPTNEADEYYVMSPMMARGGG